MSEYYYEKQKDLDKLVAEYEREDLNKTTERSIARSRTMGAMTEYAIEVINDAEFAKSMRGEDAPTDRDFWFRMFNYTHIYYENSEKRLIAKYAQIYAPELVNNYKPFPLPSLIDTWREPVRPIRSRAFNLHSDPWRWGR